jgi:hypothetical protein
VYASGSIKEQKLGGMIRKEKGKVKQWIRRRMCLLSKEILLSTALIAVSTVKKEIQQANSFFNPLIYRE